MSSTIVYCVSLGQKSNFLNLTGIGQDKDTSPSCHLPKETCSVMGKIIGINFTYQGHITCMSYIHPRKHAPSFLETAGNSGSSALSCTLLLMRNFFSQLIWFEFNSNRLRLVCALVKEILLSSYCNTTYISQPHTKDHIERAVQRITAFCHVMYCCFGRF